MKHMSQEDPNCDLRTICNKRTQNIKQQYMYATGTMLRNGNRMTDTL